MRKIFALLFMLSFLCDKSLAASLSDFSPWLWPHTTPSYDLTYDAVAEGGTTFDAWRSSFEITYKAMVEKNAIDLPSRVVVGDEQQKTGYTLTEIGFQFPSSQMFGTLLAVPHVVDLSKPIIIVIHGHEMPERGTTPWSMFDAGYWPEKWAQAGYVVFAPSHLWYSQLADYQNLGNSHYTTWVMMLSRLVDGVQPYLPAHTGMVVAGLSSGAVSASFLMAYRDDISKGVFAGSLVGLTYLRENYRIVDQPNNFDMNQLFDYAPIYALLAPKPAQWQMGRRDPFFPSTKPVPPISTYFPGLPRPVSVQDFLGEWLLIKRLWEIKGGAPDLYVHGAGHVFDFDAAKAFIETH